MGFHVFPYREEEPRPGRAPIPRPTVDLTISYSHATARARCLVDTGAPFCIFGRAVADRLEIDMGLGRGKDTQVHILGSQHTARRTMVHLELPPFEGLSWETEVEFLYDDLDLSFLGVLGQQGFLDRWVASFNLAYNYFVIEECADFNARLGIDATRGFEGHYDSEWQPPSSA